MQGQRVFYLILLWSIVGTNGYEDQYYCDPDYSSQTSFANVILNGSTVPNFSCNYHYNVQYVQFEMSSLEEVPKQLFDTFPNLVLVNFTSSGIKFINRYSLDRARNLQNLDLSSNAIEQLNANCFSGATALLELNLSFNKISSIDRMAFNTLSNLELLRLTGNKLRSLDNKVFEPLKSLHTIYLNSNELQVIEAGLFVENSKLENMLLQNNHISMVEEGALGIFISTESIVSLSNNKLRKLNLEKIKVTHLYLTNNTLDTLNLSPWIGTVYAENNIISNVTVSDVTNMQLKTLSKLDGAVYDLTKNQFNIQKDVNSLRQSLFEIRLALMANRTNGSVGADNDELRRMIETANNLTLDKQELSAKTLEFKIYEQTFKVDKALELARENSDKIVVLAKRVEQWISNIVSSGGAAGMLGHDRLPIHPSAAQVEVSSGNGYGLIIAMLVVMCLMMGMIMFIIAKFHRRSYGVERRRYANRDSSMATIINNDI
uniref:Leucine rich immune protein (TM) n=1 Tax=Anopheles arabiensis TaxID=7173 RepID=A0A8W7MK02_ANOAR